MSNILEVEGLNKIYQNFSLTDVSFALPEGCIAGFIGANGAGKTTTIRAILGLVQKASGTVRIFGQDMDEKPLAIKDRIGVVHDEGYFYDGLTMDEMKSVIAPAYSRWSDQSYQSYMKMFSLDPRQRISTLSRGMRMKYALALALSHGAELLIMDEPTSGLDPLVRSQLLDIITGYMDEGGKGVFFSTHITSDLDKVADTLILIHGGRILFVKDKDEMLEHYRLVKGDVAALSDSRKKLFLNLRTTDFGFTGVTDTYAEVKKSIPDIIAQRPTIEDIMLAYIEGGQK